MLGMRLKLKIIAHDEKEKLKYVENGHRKLETFMKIKKSIPVLIASNLGSLGSSPTRGHLGNTSL